MTMAERLGSMSPRLVVTAICILVVLTTVEKSVANAESTELEYTGSALWSRPLRAIFLDSTLYLAQAYGLQVYDLSNPSEPIRVWQQFVTSGVKDIAQLGNYLFLERGETGLYVYDISNPASPTLVDSASLEGSGRRIIVSPNSLLFRACDDRVQIINVDDPSSPTFLGVFAYPDSGGPVSYPSLGISVSRGILFLGASDLFLIDVSIPSQPTLLSRTDVPHLAVDIDIKDDTLAVVSGLSESVPAGLSSLNVYNFADPEHPLLVSELEKDGEINELSLLGNYAYVAGGSTGVAAIDLTDFSEPHPVWCLAPRGVATTTVVDQNRLLVINWAPTLLDTDPYEGSMCDSSRLIVPQDARVGDLLFYDVSSDLEPKQLGTIHQPNYATDLWIEGNLAFVTDDTRGLAIVDVSNPDTLVEVCIVSDLQRSSAVTCKGSIVYVFEQLYGLRAIDISNPSQPAVSASVPLAADWVEDMTICGDSLYIAAGGIGILVVDISVPTAPILAAIWPTADFACDVLASENYLYVADRYAGLQVIQLGDPTTNTILPEYPTDGRPIWSVFLAKVGNKLFVAAGSYVDILEVSAPLSPSLVKTVDLSSLYGLAAWRNFLCVADTWWGFRLYNCANPDSIVLVSDVHSPGCAMSVVTSGDQLYIADLFGLLRYRLPSSSDVPNTDGGIGSLLDGFRLYECHPNPFNLCTIISYNISHSAPVKLTVYDILGQAIKTLVCAQQSEGQYNTIWDGCDSGGNEVASGVYLCQLSVGHLSQTKKMLLLR
jgi:hypothetical protein